MTCRVACVGAATRDALLARGLVADAMPARFTAEALLDVLGARDDVRAGRVLYVAAEGARDVLPAGLRALGTELDVVRAYRTVSDGTGADELRDALESGRVDLVTFASASAVRGYVEAVGPELARRAPAVSIGPITSDAVRAAEIPLVAESPEATIDGVVKTVETVLRAGAPSRG
jgi:uroporphyrinogen-III synthase